MARSPKGSGPTVGEEIAKAVGAARAVALESVDFSDPARPATCLEVDFPILPVNQVATIEGNASKPIYQMSKWWARRRSSVFRSILLGASMRAPRDPAKAAKSIWDVYYANHQTKQSFSNVKVADIFMGGGTTLVEGARLGMQMSGIDLNPVAWLIVKNEFTDVTKDEVSALLADVERDVKPAIMPFYACDCPRGHKGKWTHVPTNRVQAAKFDPLTVPVEERGNYRYEGPEVIYCFWTKHGPCQVTGCGHRTPVMTSPLIAVKTLSVKAWEGFRCSKCKKQFDVEDSDARIAPDVPLVVAETETPFAVMGANGELRCPHCDHKHSVAVDEGNLGLKKAKTKQVELSLLVHPSFLAGSPSVSRDGEPLGGSATDSPEATAAWNNERARRIRLLEVRGELPAQVTCPETNKTFSTSEGTVPRKSSYACGACGTVQDILESVRPTGKTGPVAAYAVQGYCPACDAEGRAYGGRFFSAVSDCSAINAAATEWAQRKSSDLEKYWPRSELPYGFMTSMNNGGIPNHGYTHWWTMFNERQLLVQTQLLRAITKTGSHRWETREFVLGVFQQYLRNQNMFCIWNIQADKLEPMMSNSNYHPKANMVENCVFASLGRGNWTSCAESLGETLEWMNDPWELVSVERVRSIVPAAKSIKSKSTKVSSGDPVPRGKTTVTCGSATELGFPDGALDLVVTDPPFGGLLHYAELADFFYVWLRLPLVERYPEYFTSPYTPKALEVVANRARQPEDPDAFYQRLLTQCWREAHRVLKPGGILAFTFHHSEDDPWVAVLESLFEAGFYLAATYPIRSDETKGEGAKPGTFGSQKIEYDIVHVCRKRLDEPKPVSWARMRREVQEDVQQLQALLEHHAKEGLAVADLQVIKRGKALEYFSRHYGKVLVDENRPLTVKEAVVGIIQLLDEDGSKTEPPPVDAEPFTRQFLRIFNGRNEQPRDQLQKFLRGTGVAPEEFEERGWCQESKKTYRIVSPLDFAKTNAAKNRRVLSADYDQAMFLIGASYEGSGINVLETLNGDFRPHPALGALLEWHTRRGATADIRNAALRAKTIFESWARSRTDKKERGQLTLPV